jgi:class 3 adenylate cyclase
MESISPLNLRPKSERIDALRYVVLADLKGSTQFAMQMGNDAALALMDEFEDAVREGLADIATPNSGFVVKRVGDGILLVFEHFPDVVEWWLHFHGTIQFKVTNVASPTKRPFQMAVRVWVHVGEVSIRNGDANGVCVNELFKIEQLCKSSIVSGDLILTAITRDLAVSTLYPPQCCIEQLETSPNGLGKQVLLFRLRVNSDLAFLVGKDRKHKIS